MRLFCVGCGPGDPELLTLKAVKLIKCADVIFAPTARDGKTSIALSIVEKYITKSTRVFTLTFPMIKDKDQLRDHWKKNSEEIAGAVRSGKKVVYLTVGDPALYSTWIYIHRELSRAHADIEVSIVPGITSIFAFAAQAKISLAEGDQTVGIVPACYDLARVKQTAVASDTVIFLKDGRYFDSVIDMLGQAGFNEDSMIAIAQDVSSGAEILKMNKLGDMQTTKNTTQKYFSIMVAKKGDDRA
jgi:precorrin-2/cobalt-factor-2 C20-methyltransferase